MRYVLRALRLEYGPLVRAVVVNYPAVMWTGLLGAGGVYNGIVTHESERFALLKVAIIAVVTAFWPIVLVALLLR